MNGHAVLLDLAEVADPEARLASLAALGLLAWHPLQAGTYVPPSEFQPNCGSAIRGQLREAVANIGAIKRVLGVMLDVERLTIEAALEKSRLAVDGQTEKQVKRNLKRDKRDIMRCGAASVMLLSANEGTIVSNDEFHRLFNVIGESHCNIPTQCNV
eukprot:2100530-Pyramimonas_sp.AAC.1